jgi:hypothetical protein
MHKMNNGTFVIEHVLRGHWAALERERIIKEWADYTRDRLSRHTSSFKIVVEQEPGSGGKESAEATIRNLAGHICIADKPGAGRSKEVRAEPFCAMSGGKESAEATIRNLAGHICVAEFAASRHRQLSCGVIVGAGRFHCVILVNIKNRSFRCSNFASRPAKKVEGSWPPGEMQPVPMRP